MFLLSFVLLSSYVQSLLSIGFSLLLALLGSQNFPFVLVVGCIVLFLAWFVRLYLHSFYYYRLFAYTFVLFVLSIVCYLMASHFLFLFLGWECMGLCSFLLISTFVFRYKARIGGFKALYSNLVGDVFVLLSLLAFVYHFSTLALSFSLYHLLPFLFVIFPVTVKSGLYPFYDWLFQAIEGPTPVSSFLHACSIITAGVWFCLLFVSSLAFSSLPFLLAFVSSVFFALCALAWFDLKRFTASSTGFFIALIALVSYTGCFSLALFYLYYHASFKFLFFVLAGFAISVCQNFQDLRVIALNVCLFPFLLVCFVGLSYGWLGLVKESLLFTLYLSIATYTVLLFLLVFLSFAYSVRFLTFSNNQLVFSPVSFVLAIFFLGYLVTISGLYFFVFLSLHLGPFPFLNGILVFLVFLAFGLVCLSCRIFSFLDLAFYAIGGLTYSRLVSFFNLYWLDYLYVILVV